jgi:chromosome segregation ATPase
MICEKCEALSALIDGYRRERDEAINALHGVQASLQRKVRHCDEIEQERDNALRERDEARAEVEQLRKMAHDFEVMREDRINCWRERAELMRVNKGVARHGIITESVRQLTELLGTERQNTSANETTDAAAVEIKRLRAEAATLRKDYDSALEANVGLLDDAPWADVRRAYRRGAEAMRFACQQWCRAWENNGEAIADALADLRVEE